ncbi:MAG: ornithine cyclodeaminase [Saccharofermentans sp.]|nr:ornithine cyclodeaminase [Saccharofermentans sp.]
MKAISFKNIADMNISPLMCYEWAEYMIKNKKQTILPPKISLKPSDGVFCNVMSSMVYVDNIAYSEGVKVVTRYPDRVPSLESRILLLDADSGEFLALMDGTWITAMRTGAVAAHSITTFAKKDYRIIGLMGLGNVVRSTMLILLEKDPDRVLDIKLLKYKGQELDFAKRFEAYKNLHFNFVDTAEEMITGTDIVISGATYLPNDVCKDELFEEGVLVLPIHTLGFTNCDLFFDKVFADDTGHVHHFKNFDKFKHFAEVSEVVNGIKPGRENDKERILAYNIGISIHDIYFARKIYQLMENKGVLDTLPDIEMDDPTEKFWI